MSYVRLALLLPLLLSGLWGCATEPHEDVYLFSEDLKEMILSDDTASFESLLAKQNPGEESYIKDQVDYVFGVDSGGFSIKGFLEGVDIEIYAKPFLKEGGGFFSTYLVVYYDKEKIDFSKPVSEEQLKKYWNVGYVETVIERTDGGWFFIDSAFYYGSAPSWSEDY